MDKTPLVSKSLRMLNYSDLLQYTHSRRVVLNLCWGRYYSVQRSHSLFFLMRKGNVYFKYLKLPICSQQTSIDDTHSSQGWGSTFPLQINTIADTFLNSKKCRSFREYIIQTLHVTYTSLKTFSNFNKTWFFFQ